MVPEKLIFLPGAGGNKTFWQPVSDLIRHSSTREFVEWPGIGGVSKKLGVECIDDLATIVAEKIDKPSAIIAQSMGGVVALLSVLRRPELVTHIVLCATSGGIDVSDIRSEDWRPAYLEANPTYPHWFTDYNDDLTSKISSIGVPVLLIWGDADLLSPIAIGEKLRNTFLNSHLELIAGGDHSFANILASSVAPLIESHLKYSSQ